MSALSLIMSNDVWRSVEWNVSTTTLGGPLVNVASIGPVEWIDSQPPGMCLGTAELPSNKA